MCRPVKSLYVDDSILEMQYENQTKIARPEMTSIAFQVPECPLLTDHNEYSDNAIRDSTMTRSIGGIAGVLKFSGHLLSCNPDGPD
jgi:hypothetical protein